MLRYKTSSIARKKCILCIVKMQLVRKAGNVVGIVMQAMEDVVQLLIAYAIIFATLNTLLWVNCSEKDR